MDNFLAALMLGIFLMGCTMVRAPGSYDRTIRARGGMAYITYTDNMQDGLRGYQIANRIYIRPSLQDDKGVLAHELEHVAQWYTSPFMSIFNRELRAYRKEIQTYPVYEQRNHAEWVADRMRGPIYRFNIGREKLIGLLLRK